MSNTPYAAKALIKRQSRRKQVRRNIIILILSVLLAVALSILFISFSTQANDTKHQPSYKYYKSIEVSKGDTLWSIAKNNIDSRHYKSTREYVAEVKKLNSLPTDNIIAGSYIIIPYYSEEFISDNMVN